MGILDKRLSDITVRDALSLNCWRWALGLMFSGRQQPQQTQYVQIYEPARQPEPPPPIITPEQQKIIDYLRWCRLEDKIPEGGWARWYDWRDYL